MSKDTDTGSMREARMAAKKLVRKGETTYQQALDMVAREQGHRNWSAFVRSERGDDTAERPARTRSVGRRREIDEVETLILEDAATNRKVTPWMPVWAMAPGSAFLGIVMFSAVFAPLSMIFALAAALIVAVAGAAARRSGDGLVDIRHAIRKWVTPLSSIVWVIGALLVVGTIALGVTGTLTGPGLLEGTWPVYVYVSGVTGYYVSTRSHRAMTLACPESVRPERMPDLTIAATEAIISKRTGAVVRMTTYLALGLSFTGLAGMAYAIIDMFIHKGVDMQIVGWSFGLVMTGVLIAMVLAPGMGLDQGTREIRVEDASRRAARARRFLRAGTSPAR